MARSVRDFYERHPYPPPVADLGAYRERWAEPGRRRAEFHLFWPGRPCREDLSILVAGCGTSQAARYAVRWPRARVVGVDVSEASLDGNRVLQRRHGLDDLELSRLRVEDARELGERFDLVVCTGVLHHLPDPGAGLAALRDVMEPDGAMHLMVYARHGRAGVYLLQDYCRRLGIGDSTEEIRRLASTLAALSPDHPLVPLIRRAPDFRTEAGLADALLHPRDRPFSVPELFDLLARAGMRFGRWIRQAPYLPVCGAPADTPHRALLERLPPAEQYAAMELFRGTMVRHSAVAHRSDAPDDVGAPRLDGDSWTAYVPLRRPDTICVEERLPPSAAGVLINRGHAFPDLHLPVDAVERRLVEAIDGRRTVAELCREEGVGVPEARAFFARLWDHDQVIFDTSLPAGRSPERV